MLPSPYMFKMESIERIVSLMNSAILAAIARAVPYEISKLLVCHAADCPEINRRDLA
jgi:hypothetical protein